MFYQLLLWWLLLSAAVELILFLVVIISESRPEETQQPENVNDSEGSGCGMELGNALRIFRILRGNRFVVFFEKNRF